MSKKTEPKTEPRSVASLLHGTEHDHAKALRKNLVRAQRIARLIPKTPAERLALGRKRRRKEAEAQGRVLTPDGLTLKMKAQLQAAQRHAEADPQARAVIASATLRKRIEVAKRENGISLKPVPQRFMGASSAEALERSEGAAPLPPRIADVRASAAQPAKRRRP